MAATDLQNKIIKQVEYYFSDINLRKDRFLKEKLTENDGWVPLSTLLTFNRLKSLSSDEKEILEAMKLSSNNVVESSDKGIKRVEEFENPDSDIAATYGAQSIYAKGFDSNCTLDDITEWFESSGFKFKSIHLRRVPRTKRFKGSVFVIMDSVEEAKRFVDCKDSTLYKGTVLIKKLQDDYFEDKKKEADARAEKKIAHQALQEKIENAQAESVMVKGVLMRLSNLPDCNTEKPVAGEKRAKQENGESKPMIVFKKWIIDQGGDVAEGLWIDIDPKANVAIIKLKKEGSAENLLKILQEHETGMMYKEKKLEGSVLTGEDELNYWKNSLSKKKFRGKRSGNRPGGHFKKRR